MVICRDEEEEKRKGERSGRWGVVMSHIQYGRGRGHDGARVKPSL